MHASESQSQPVTVLRLSLFLDPMDRGVGSQVATHMVMVRVGSWILLSCIFSFSSLQATYRNVTSTLLRCISLACVRVIDLSHAAARAKSQGKKEAACESQGGLHGPCSRQEETRVTNLFRLLIAPPANLPTETTCSSATRLDFSWPAARQPAPPGPPRSTHLPPPSSNNGRSVGLLDEDDHR
jgi:hypothetical protein